MTPEPPPRAWPRRAAACLAAAAILQQASSGGGFLTTPPCTFRPELQPVVLAAGPIAHLPGRLTGCYDGIPRPGSAPPDRDTARRMRAAAYEVSASSARFDPQRDAALGSMYLATGREDRAVTLLERAVATPEARPAWASDLAAAYLTRAARQERYADVVAALAAAERALARDPSIVEAWFNRAAALEALALPRAADGWAAYLHRDWRSPAAAIVRERRARLDAEEAARPAERRALAGLDRPELTGYFAWAGAVLAGDDEARVRAEQALGGMAGEAEGRGERFHRSALAGLVRPGLSNGGRLELAGGLIELERGFAALARDDLGQAGLHFARASHQLTGRCEPLRALADLRRAIVSYYTDAPAVALSLLRRVEAEARQVGSELLLARALRVRGLIETNRGEYAAALESYGGALDAARRVGAIEQAAALRTLVSEVLEYLGQHTDAWQHRTAALRDLPSVADVQARQMILVTSALTAARDGYPEAAAHFAGAALDAASASGHAADLAEAWTLIARTARELGHEADASRALDAAANAVGRIADPSLRARNAAELALARAAAGIGGADVDGALQYFSSIDALARLAEVYYARAAARHQARDGGGARDELLRAVATFEARARTLDDRERRLTHDSTGRPLYEALIAQYAAGTDAWEALHAVERYRLRFQSTGQPSVLPGAAALRAGATRVPGTGLVFAVQPDRLLIWRITAGDAQLTERRISRQHLGALIDTFNEAIIENDEGGVRDVGRLLFTLLLGPPPAAGQRLWIVPDGPLHRLPFAALPDPANGRPAVERWVLVQHGSVAAAAQPPRRRGRLRALIVGNPSADAAALQESEREARDIAALYGRDGTLLTAAAATSRAIQRELPQAGILHFGGHAIVNPDRPLLSRLLLAPEAPGGNPGALFVYDIERLRLAHVDLAVLAACRSADARAGGVDGVASLAGALLGSGVGTVVATLFDIDDAAARRLFVRFHEEFRRTGDGAASLREAQLAEARAGTAARLSDWSGIVAIGE